METCGGTFVTTSQSLLCTTLLLTFSSQKVCLRVNPRAYVSCCHFPPPLVDSASHWEATEERTDDLGSGPKAKAN